MTSKSALVRWWWVAAVAGVVLLGAGAAAVVEDSAAVTRRPRRLAASGRADGRGCESEKYRMRDFDLGLTNATTVSPNGEPGPSHGLAAD